MGEKMVNVVDGDGKARGEVPIAVLSLRRQREINSEKNEVTLSRKERRGIERWKASRANA